MKAYLLKQQRKLKKDKKMTASSWKECLLTVDWIEKEYPGTWSFHLQKKTCLKNGYKEDLKRLCLQSISDPATVQRHSKQSPLLKRIKSLHLPHPSILNAEEPLCVFLDTELCPGRDGRTETRVSCYAVSFAGVAFLQMKGKQKPGV